MITSRYAKFHSPPFFFPLFPRVTPIPSLLISSHWIFPEDRRSFLGQAASNIASDDQYFNDDPKCYNTVYNKNPNAQHYVKAVRRTQARLPRSPDRPLKPGSRSWAPAGAPFCSLILLLFQYGKLPCIFAARPSHADGRGVWTGNGGHGRGPDPVEGFGLER